MFILDGSFVSFLKPKPNLRAISLTSLSVFIVSSIVTTFGGFGSKS